MIKDSDWRNRLLSNRLTLVCTCTLLIIILSALFAYIFISDNTKNANRQIPEIALSAPGSFHSFILKPKNIDFPTSNIIEKYLTGRRDKIDFIPYDTLFNSQGHVISTYKTTQKFHDDLKMDEIETRLVYYLMGTDKYGRDVFSRLILGVRVSLIIGFFSVLVSVFLGITIGSLGGYYGGWTDKIIMLLINTSWSIPTLLMAFAIIIALGKGFFVIILAVGLTMWVDVARIVRGQVMQVKNELFVKASRIMGFNNYRIISRHILPNIIGSILVMAAANFATAILVEAGLSYLGLGIQPPTPSLGNMLQESYAYATGGFVYLAIFPILTIMVLVLCFNLLGTGLRDVFDIKTAQT